MLLDPSNLDRYFNLLEHLTDLSEHLLIRWSVFILTIIALIDLINRERK